MGDDLQYSPIDYSPLEKRVERRDIYPWGTFIIDPATGLPQLEDGMFFRVKRVFLSGGHWKVSLRRRGAFWSHELQSRTWGPEDAIDAPHILDGAAFALTHYWEAEEARKVESNESLLGNYPPKRLP